MSDGQYDLAASGSGGVIAMAGLILLNVVAVVLFGRWYSRRKRGR